MIAPRSGGRIASLVDRATGHEWMWAPPGGQSRHRAESADFAASPMVGADECIPTVGACTIDGVEYADHGDAWQREWRIASESPQQACELEVELPRHGLTFNRHAAADGSRMQLDYRVDRRPDSMLPWLWSWHPLLAMPVFPRLGVSGVTGVPRVEGCSGMNKDDSAFSLPIEDRQSGLRRLDLGGTHRSAKLFFDAEPTGEVVLSDDATGAYLKVGWHGAAIRGFGLWINRGGWNGYEHVALEPCTMPFESPVDLPSGYACPSSARWTLDIEVGRLPEMHAPLQ
ncbi:MAG: hypothetical protein AAFR96_10985 [Planctomycetota bacterium]